MGLGAVGPGAIGPGTAGPLSGPAVPCVQVILCFSPVGSVLRVRARKFPAVVNCTAIDWFHEWPEDALVSVSARFLEETEGIQVRHGARPPPSPSVALCADAHGAGIGVRRARYSPLVHNVRNTQNLSNQGR